MPSFLLNVSSRKFLSCVFVLIIMIGVFTPATSYALVSPPISLLFGDCGFLTGNLVDCVGYVLAKIVWILMTIMSFVLWVAGALLDYVIQETVLTMKEGVDKMTGINIAWKVIRDLMNIAFIFLLVYEGIKMIIGLSDLGKIKRFVTMVVLASLLVNFSLFFTKVMIDASNIVTIGVYDSLVVNTIPTSSGTGTGLTRPLGGLSIPFMSALGITNFYDQRSFDRISSDLGGGTNMLIFFGMGTIIFLVASFVFFAIACMFVVRYITLIILLMLSPIAYMGMALPFIKPYASQWWKALNSQLLFAPIYMIMTSVILTLMSSPGFLNSNSTGTSVVPSSRSWGELLVGGSSGASSMSLILNFSIVIGLAIASLVIAKNTSTEGSKFISKATGALTVAAGGVALGGAAALGRRTIGAGASSVANDQGLKDRAAGIGVNRFQQVAAQAKLNVARKAGAGSFDGRRSRIGETIASQAGVSLGKGTEGVPFLGNAKAGQGGRTQAIKDKDKARKEYIESLKPGIDEVENREYAQNTLSGKTPEDVARMKAILDNEEEERKEKFDSAAAKEALAEKKEPLKEARIKAEEDMRKAEEKVRLAEAENVRLKAGAEEKVRLAEAENVRLKAEFERIKREEERPGGNSAKVKEAEDALRVGKTTLEAERGNLREKVEANKTALDTEKANLQEAVTAHKTAQDAITKIESDAAKERKEYKSKEHKELITTSEQDDKTIYGERVKAYATSVESGWRGMVGMRPSQVNKDAARAIRKASKEKTLDEQWAELGKKAWKEEEEARKKAGEEEDEEEDKVTPVAPPPPPTTEESPAP